MYFISLSAEDTNQEELALWTQCVGPANVSTADTFQNLLTALGSVLETETGYFIN